MERTRYIPIHDLVSCDGVVAEDVMSSDGQVCLLPKGTNLSFDVAQKSLPTLIRQLDRRGVSMVLISQERHYSLNELKKVVEKLDLSFAQEIDRNVAKDAVNKVETIYSRLAHHAVTDEDYENLVDVGKGLAKEIQRLPQVAMSLSAIQSVDEYTFVHSLNVALLAGFIAKQIEPENLDFIEAVTVGGLLHDLGKSQIPQEILNKPGPLSEEEFKIIKNHSALGARMAIEAGVKNTHTITLIRNHHERWDGKGYPDGFKALNIPLAARIGAVADVFDALTTKRVYHDGYHSARALQMIIEGTGTHFDKTIVQLLLHSIGLYPPGTIVQLSDNSMGIVVGCKERDLFRPQILIQEDSSGKPYDEPYILDLHEPKTDIFVKDVLGSAGKRSVGGDNEEPSV